MGKYGYGKKCKIDTHIYEGNRDVVFAGVIVNKKIAQ